MTNKLSLEERVAYLENEINKLKQKILKPESGIGWQEACGTFKNDPDFKELLHLGREFRKSYSDDTSA